MRVQMKTKIGGYRDGVEWPEKGGVIDVPAHEAQGLIANGYAEAFDHEPEITDADQDAAEPGNDQGEAADADSDTPADADSDGATEPGAEADTGDDASEAVTAAPARSKRSKG